MYYITKKNVQLEHYKYDETKKNDKILNKSVGLRVGLTNYSKIQTNLFQNML